MDKNNLPAAKSSLSKKLAQLNAAIADLLQALSGINIIYTSLPMAIYLS